MDPTSASAPRPSPAHTLWLALTRALHTPWLADVAAGTLGGIAGKLIEYPFDTIKVRLQSAQQQACAAPTASPAASSGGGPIAALRALLASEGAFGLYRGMSLPLAGTVLETATLFTANGWLKRTLAERGALAPGSELPLPYVLASGAGTGFAVSWVLTPIELVKCRMQVSGQPLLQSGGGGGGGGGGGNGLLTHHPHYASPFDCLQRAVASEEGGGLRVLYRGHVGTMLREVPGTACWFGAYETFLRAMTPMGSTRSDLPPWTIIAAGALGGMSYWTIMYPADTVKTQMQTAGGGDGGSQPVGGAGGGISDVERSGPGRPSTSGASVSVASGSGSPHHAATFAAPARGVPPRMPSFLSTFGAIYRHGGVRALYAGVTPTIIRAAPSNAVIFLVYEEAIKAFSHPHGAVVE